MPDLPMACTLTANDMSKRLADMAALGNRALVSSELDETGRCCAFGPNAGIRSEVDWIVAAESECCAFLFMRIEDGEHLMLTIELPRTPCRCWPDL